MYDVSEAVISYSDFENFNGQTFDPTNSSFPLLLSYGMKANPVTGTNNNIVLFHNKGKNNAVFYDSSIFGQDGPIVIGGDVFPVVLAYPTPNTGFTGSCYGFINAGPMQMYGTHFDSGLNNNDSGTPACYAVKMLNSALVKGKFESSVSGTKGNAILIQGGSVSSFATVTLTRNGTTPNFYVSSGTIAANSLAQGQVVNVKSCSDNSFNGNFTLTSATSSTTLDWDAPVSTGSSATGCTITGVATNAANVEGIFANVSNAVTIGSNASNNTVTATIPSTSNTSVPSFSDGGVNDNFQILTSLSPTFTAGSQNTSSGNRTIFAGTLQVPAAAGLTTATNGQVGYDTTAQVPHTAVNSLDAKIATFTAAPTTGDCATWVGTTPSTQIGDSGGGCNNAVLMFFCSGPATSSTTITLEPGSTAATCTSTGTPAEQPLPFGGTLKNLYVNVGTKPSGTDSVTVYHGGISTSMTCNVTTTIASCHDITDTVTGVSPGDTISIRVVTSATETLKDVHASVQLQ
jgi:hypothetical protein